MDVSVMCDRALFAHDQIKGDYHRNVAYFDNALQERLVLRSYVVHEMRTALREERFLVYLQPVYDISARRIIGAEALVRWEDAGLKSCPISVNISRIDLQRPNFIHLIQSLLTRYDLSPSDLRLEITESAFVRTDMILETLEQLHARGFTILMDDFGRGYSNFNTFAVMPVDILKADIGFMQNLNQSRKGRNVLQSIREMTARLGMPIVAEGIETADQLSYLQQIGCEYAQGFYYARPMPEDDFVRYLR